MGQHLQNNVIVGISCLLCGIALGISASRAMEPSQAQSSSRLLEEKVQLLVGGDNRPLGPDHQRESLAMVVGLRLLDAVANYAGADSASRESIQRSVERVLHAGILDDIPYADRRNATQGLARCIQAHPHDDEALQICMQQIGQTVPSGILPPQLYGRR